MKICDRCGRKLDNNKETVIGGQKFELCNFCEDHISNHIRNYNPNANKGGIIKKVVRQMVNK